jgi:hypothetical protein
MGIDREVNRDPFHRAVRWIERQRRTDPRVVDEALVVEAAARFDLPPVAQEILRKTIVGKNEK